MQKVHFIQTKYHNFNDFSSVEYAPGLSGQSATQLMLMYRRSVEKKQPVILELGAAKGASTTVFLQACEEQDGRLVSVDLADCSEISNSQRWQFIQADSTNVEFILSQAPYLADGIDILYIDSLHTREHVEKELMGWYPYLNEKSWIFFDDVDANPYRKGQRKDNFSMEAAFNEIHDYIKTFFYANENSLYLNIIYGSTGLASLYKLSKKGTVPHLAKSINHRKNTVFNRFLHKLINLKRKMT